MGSPEERKGVKVSIERIRDYTSIANLFLPPPPPLPSLDISTTSLLSVKSLANFALTFNTIQYNTIRYIHTYIHTYIRTLFVPRGLFRIKR